MLSNTPKAWLYFNRTIRFGETDAAGVIHFHNVLRWSHEAWEESLELFGIESSKIFPGNGNFNTTPPISLPIVHCEVDYKKPIFNGNKLDIKIQPKIINEISFEVITRFDIKDSSHAISILRHKSITSETRKVCPLPKDIIKWLEKSN